MNRLALHSSVTIIYEYQKCCIIRHTVVDHFIHTKYIIFASFVLSFVQTTCPHFTGPVLH